jgi:hypothetical protein
MGKVAAGKVMPERAVNSGRFKILQILLPVLPTALNDSFRNVLYNPVHYYSLFTGLDKGTSRFAENRKSHFWDICS